MQALERVLGSLSDVDGVIGGFVISDSGSLLGSNLPAVFDADVFSDAGPRIVRLVEASAAANDGLKSCVLRFSEHKLFVKELDGAFLGVLMTGGGSVPALKVAANIATRKLSALVSSGALDGAASSAPPISGEASGPPTHRSPASNPLPPQPPLTITEPVPAPPLSASTGTPSRRMTYRGRTIG